MAEIQRFPIKMLCNGMVISLAGDLMPKGKFHFLQNIRIFEEGVLESRPMLSSFLDLQTAVAKPTLIKKIINKANGDFLFIVATNTGELFTGKISPLPMKDAGYSNKPPFIIDFRPEQSVEAYAYIADENKFKKISVSDILSDVGIIAPTLPVLYQIGKPERKIIDAIGVGSDVAWNNLTGSAIAPVIDSRVDTVVDAFLQDDILPGFVTIVPDVMQPNLQAGSILTINGADQIVVEEVLPSSVNIGIATISNIKYDVGATGLCTIVLSVSNTTIKQNSILLLNGVEYVRVIDVTLGDNNILSIRTETAGTFVAGNSVSGVPAFRFFSNNAYGAGNTIKNDAIKVSITADGISSATRVFNVDLTNTGTKPLTEDDIFHISLLISDPSSITEVQVQLDVDSAVNDFTRNYYYFPISPNFFTGSAAQTTPTPSIIQQIIQRQELINRISRFSGDAPLLDASDFEGRFSNSESFGPQSISAPIGQTALGLSQWAEMSIKLKDFKRVGSDLSRTLKDVKAIRVSVNSTAALDVFIDSLWVGGSDALDTTQQGFWPYNYVWRIRDPKTRVRSNWSPPLRNGIKISRGHVELSFPNANILYPANYEIDIARFGGNLTTWRLVGTIKNNGTTYVDKSSDRVVADNEAAGRFDDQASEDAVFNFYKPFAILDSPKSGTCDVIGTTLKWKTGDKLNISYPRGVQIVINGIANRFYANPTDPETVELERDMGNLVDVPFEAEEPLLTGQPLPVVFGPIGEGNFGLFLFGFGDKNAAGTLYWLDGNSPDTQSELNRLEITSPSEPLVAGIIYDGFAFVWSIARSWMIMPTVAADGTFGFVARENANSRGCFSRWGIAVGPSHIFFISENADGIYRVQGNGNPQNITRDAIENLFFKSGQAPKSINIFGIAIDPPNWQLKEEIRLFTINDYLFFRYVDINDQVRILVFDNKIDAWISYDNYITNSINAFYLEEDDAETPRIFVGLEAKVAQLGGIGDLEEDENVSSIVIPFSFDADDIRFLKEFKEIVIDADQGENGFDATQIFNNGDLINPPNMIAGNPAHKRQQFIINLQDDEGNGTLAKNITTKFDWEIDGGVRLFGEIIYFIPAGDEITNRSADIETGGNIADKLWNGVVIQADTHGQDKTLNYYDDKGELKATLTINHDGEKTVAYSFENPFISHTIRRTSNDNVAWIPTVEAYITDPEPELAEVWEGEFNTSGLTGLKIIHRMAIAYRSNSDGTIKLTFDDGIEQTYNLPNSNGNWHQEFFFTFAKKWKGCKYRIHVENGIRVYKDACEVWMKSSGSQQPFQRFQPFGGPSNREVLI